MVRTKAQAIRESSPPPWDKRILVRTFDDHDSAPVKIAWACTNGDSSPLPPFPFFVYLIRGAGSLTVDETLIDKLVSCLQSQQLCDPCWHLEVFTTIQENVCACIDHYEHEKTFRKIASRSPYMPDNDCFIVVDSDQWEDEGLLSVQYTKENVHLPYNMNAQRYKSWHHLATHLREQWSTQGMTTLEELLDGQNLARGWPIDTNLYPEGDPDESVNGKTIAAYEPSSSTLHHTVHQALDLESICVHVDGVIDEQRQDSEGFPYIALWHYSSQAPRFVFCLFVLGRKITSKDSLRVFARLNTGLLADVPWTLHLYSNATLASAASIFARDMNFRRHTDTPAPVPSSYVGPPLQNYRGVYMCLDASKPQPDGPSFILSSPDPCHTPPPKHDVDPDVLDHLPSAQDRYAGEPDSLDLFTFNPGSWELAADMLHTYYAICSHTQSIAGSLASFIPPRITLSISVNPVYSSDPAIPSPIELLVTSHATLPITLNVKGSIFDTSNWCYYLRVVHAASLVELPRNTAAERKSRLWSSGRSLLDYGFTKRVPDTGEERPPHLVTLHPGVPVRLPVQRPLPAEFLAELRPDENEDDRRFLDDYEVQGKAHFNSVGVFQQSLYESYRGNWEVGNKYTVELQHDTTIPRWSWGTADNLQGPYGLPALNIELKEGGNGHFMLVD